MLNCENFSPSHLEKDRGKQHSEVPSTLRHKIYWVGGPIFKHRCTAYANAAVCAENALSTIVFFANRYLRDIFHRDSIIGGKSGRIDTEKGRETLAQQLERQE